MSYKNLSQVVYYDLAKQVIFTSLIPVTFTLSAKNLVDVLINSTSYIFYIQLKWIYIFITCPHAWLVFSATFRNRRIHLSEQNRYGLDALEEVSFIGDKSAWRNGFVTL